MSERLAYSPAEAAAILGVSRQHVYELMHQGYLPSVKLGARRLIRRERIEAMLAELESHELGAA